MCQILSLYLLLFAFCLYMGRVYLFIYGERSPPHAPPLLFANFVWDWEEAACFTMSHAKAFA